MLACQIIKTCFFHLSLFFVLANFTLLQHILFVFSLVFFPSHHPTHSYRGLNEFVSPVRWKPFFFLFPEKQKVLFPLLCQIFFSPLTCSWVQSRWACIPSDNKVWALSQRWNTINFCVGLNFSWHTFTFNFIFHPPTPNLRNVWIPAAMLRPALSRGMLSAHTDSAARTVRSEITASPGVTGCSKASWHKGVFSD